MKSVPAKHQAAFTFVELLVTVTVMLLVLVLGLVNYLKFLEKQKLYQFGSQIESLLKDARAKAQQGFLGNENIGFCEQLKAIEVFSTQDSNGYLRFQAQVRCGDNQALLYEDYLVTEKNVILSGALQVSYLPIRGANLQIDGQRVTDGTLTLSRSSQTGENAAQVLLNLDQGGAIEVKYE